MRTLPRVLPAAILAAALTAALAACTPLVPPEKTENDAEFWEISLEEGNLVLQWKVDTTAETLEIIVTAPTTGWVGVGFDPTTRMLGANILIGWVDDTGVATVRDDYGNSQTSHQPDVDGGGFDNVAVDTAGSSQGTTSTTLHYTIPLDSNDERDRPLTPGATHRFLISYGADDDVTQKHLERYSFDMEL